MSDRSEFYLSGARSVARIELMEVTHPNFTKDYYLCRNVVEGVNVVLEDARRVYFGFYPIQIAPTTVSDDLDRGFTLTIGDTGDTLPTEIEAVYNADGFRVRPKFVYREYRSDNLTVPLAGPLNLEIADVTEGIEGFTFVASSPGANYSKTGELYRIDRFIMLRGTL